MPRLLPLLLKISLPLIILDQITKWYVVMNYRQPFAIHDGVKYILPSHMQDKTVVVDGFFNIIRVHNQGVAFGMGNGSSWAPIVFLIVPFVALTVVTVLWKKGVFAGIAKWSAPLLIAGVIGNLIDRLSQGFFLKGLEGESFWTRLSEGYVVDFLDFTIPLVNYRWPSFNVADSCICIAASLLFLSAFRQPDAESNKEKETGEYASADA